MKKMSLLLTLAIVFNPSSGWAKNINWLGTDEFDREVTFITKSSPGQQYSFFAIMAYLNEDKKSINLYLMEKTSPDVYSMNLIFINKGGMLAKEGAPRRELLMLDAQSGGSAAKIVNTNGSGGYVIFDGTASEYSWSDLQKGTFSLGDEDNALDIINYNKQEFRGKALFSSRNLSGRFDIIGVMPGVYQFHDLQKNSAKGMGIFLKYESKGFLSSGTGTELLFFDNKAGSNYYEPLSFIQGAAKSSSSGHYNWQDEEDLHHGD